MVFVFQFRSLSCSWSPSDSGRLLLVVAVIAGVVVAKFDGSGSFQFASDIRKR